MFENYAWGQTLSWGSFKHPPLFAWVTHFWFVLFPTTNLSYFFLSYCNAAIGLLGLVCLTRLLLKGYVKSPQIEQIYIVLVLGLSVLSLPFNFYAAIFNADSISLSLWPWTAYAFFAAVEAPKPVEKWVWSLILGILSTATILGKYYGVVLLLTLFIISLSEVCYRKWYKTPYPYVTFMIFVGLLAPHAVWEVQQGFPFTHYYSHYTAVSYKKIASHIVTFALTGIYFYLISWGMYWFVRPKFPDSSEKSSIIQHKAIWLLAFLPAMLTCILSMAGSVSVMDRWAIPAWFALPIFMVNRLSVTLDELRPRLKYLAWSWVGFLFLIVSAFFYTYNDSYSYLGGHHDYVEARKEMVQSIQSHFQKRFPGENLSWVSGSVWPDHLAPLSYYLPNHPRALPGFPDEMPALVNPYPEWNSTYGVMVCGKKYADSDSIIEDCAVQTRNWLRNKNISVQEEEIVYRAHGWRWQHLSAPQRHVRVFWLTPSLNGLV